MIWCTIVLNASIINNGKSFPQEYLCSYSVKFQIQVSSVQTWLWHYFHLRDLLVSHHVIEAVDSSGRSVLLYQRRMVHRTPEFWT